MLSIRCPASDSVLAEVCDAVFLSFRTELPQALLASRVPCMAVNKNQYIPRSARTESGIVATLPEVNAWEKATPNIPCANASVIHSSESERCHDHIAGEDFNGSVVLASQPLEPTSC